MALVSIQPEGPKLPVAGRDSLGFPLKAAVGADKAIGFGNNVDPPRELAADAVDPHWNMLWNVEEIQTCQRSVPSGGA